MGTDCKQHPSYSACCQALFGFFGRKRVLWIHVCFSIIFKVDILNICGCLPDHLWLAGSDGVFVWLVFGVFFYAAPCCWIASHHWSLSTVYSTEQQADNSTANKEDFTARGGLVLGEGAEASCLWLTSAVQVLYFQKRAAPGWNQPPHCKQGWVFQRWGLKYLSQPLWK